MVKCPMVALRRGKDLHRCHRLIAWGASFIRVALRKIGGERLLKYQNLDGKLKIKQSILSDMR